MIDGAEEPLIKFTSKLKAEQVKRQIVNSFELVPIFKKIDSKLHYNERFEAILAKYRYPYHSFFIIANGKNGNQKCAIRIKNGKLLGYALYEPTYINTFHELDEMLIPIQEFSNTKKNILNFIHKNKKYIQIIAHQ
jgi:hypothetical protein